MLFESAREGEQKNWTYFTNFCSEQDGLNVS